MIGAQVSTYTEQINKAIAKLDLPYWPAELYEPIRYILDLEGKRFRPILVLLAHELYKPIDDQVVQAAVALELFHNFTLVHDDIMDEAPMRRGQPTVHQKWNCNIGMLSGDVMLVYVYELLSKINSNYLPKILEEFSICARKVCEGQQLDMNFEQVLEVSEQDYLEMIRLKTGVLPGFCMRLGAMLAGAPIDDQKKLTLFGEQLGVGFQLKDDYLDAFGGKRVGKRVGGDILANKKTLLLIKALELSNSEEQSQLIGHMALDQHDAQRKIDFFLAFFQKLGIDQICEEKSQQFFDLALGQLEQLPVPANKKESLMGFTKQLIKRQH